MFFFRQKEPTEDENEGDKRQSSDWSWTKTFSPVHLKENWYYFTQELLNLHRYFACFLFFFFYTVLAFSRWCNLPKRRSKNEHTIEKLKTGNMGWNFYDAKIMALFLFTWDYKKSLTFLFPKIWFLILPTSCHNFLSKLIKRISSVFCQKTKRKKEIAIRLMSWCILICYYIGNV